MACILPARESASRCAKTSCLSSWSMLPAGGPCVCECIRLSLQHNLQTLSRNKSPAMNFPVCTSYLILVPPERSFQPELEPAGLPQRLGQLSLEIYFPHRPEYTCIASFATFCATVLSPFYPISSQQPSLWQALSRICYVTRHKSARFGNNRKGEDGPPHLSQRRRPDHDRQRCLLVATRIKTRQSLRAGASFFDPQP